MSILPVYGIIYRIISITLTQPRSVRAVGVSLDFVRFWVNLEQVLWVRRSYDCYANFHPVVKES